MWHQYDLLKMDSNPVQYPHDLFAPTTADVRGTPTVNECNKCQYNDQGRRMQYMST